MFATPKVTAISPEDRPIVQHVSQAENLGDDVKRHEHAMIVDVLRGCMGNRKIAAEKLGISPRTLRYKLARMRDEGMAVPGL
jgi:two-component system response regulator FlrC